MQASRECFLEEPHHATLLVLQGDFDGNDGDSHGIATTKLIAMHIVIEGSLEVKLPTTWTVEKQR